MNHARPTTDGGNLVQGTPERLGFVSRQRRRRTFVVWLSLPIPMPPAGLLEAWKTWVATLEASRPPIPVDLLVIPPPFGKGHLTAPGPQDLDTFFDRLRAAGRIWVTMVRWRDRRDLHKLMAELLADLPDHFRVDYITMHVMEGKRLVYEGTAQAIAQTNFMWTE